jgi:hypothetical protein
VKIVDMHKRRFGRLVVSAHSGSDARGEATWIASCDCGAVITCTGNNLRRGLSKSCGCLCRERNSVAHRTHGESGPMGRASPEYRAWRGMNERCYYEQGVRYMAYGGRGIRVCQAWLGPVGFQTFLIDMGRKPSPRHSLDRIDVNGHYEPGNCRWATDALQRRNRRNSRLITYNGFTRTLGEWAAIIGVGRSSLSERLDRWSIDRALTPPHRNMIHAVRGLEPAKVGAA